jgi:hypothetical protein
MIENKILKAETSDISISTDPDLRNLDLLGQLDVLQQENSDLLRALDSHQRLL